MISFCFHPFADVMMRVMSVIDFHCPMLFDIEPVMRSPIAVIQHHRVLGVKIRCHFRIYS